MKKRFMVSVLVLIFLFMVGGCGKTDKKPALNSQASTEEKSDEQKKKEGYKRYQDIGLEFKMGDVWKNNKNNIDLGGIGDSENPNEPIYGGLSYGFASNEMLKEYEEAKKITDEKERSKKINEIFSNEKQLCSFVVLRKDKMPSEDKINALTEYKNNDKISEVENFIFYFSYNDYDDSGLSDEAKKTYKLLYDDIQNVKKSANTFKPVTPQEAISKLGKIEFKLKDLKGKEFISSDIFKENKLTMINIWATFCGPCKKELPELQMLYNELKPQSVNVIGIIGDTPDPDNEVAAVKILDTKKVDYLNLIPNKKFTKDVIGSIAGYPTTIFVDSNGKVVGKVITGQQSKEEYEKVIMDILSTLK